MYKKRTISFWDQYSSLGGAQQVLLALLESAVASGFLVTLYCPCGDLAEQAASRGAVVRHISEPDMSIGRKSPIDVLKLLAFSLLFLMRYRVELCREKIIYVNGPRLVLASLLYSFFARSTRFIYHIHLAHGKMESLLLALAVRRPNCVAVAVPSVYLREHLTAFSPAFTSSKLHVIPNGLTRAFSSLPFTDRFDGEIKSIVLPGRVSPEKGHDLLPVLAREFPAQTFHVIGAPWPAHQEWYRQLQCAVPGNVVFHGWHAYLPRAVAEVGAQVCLVPSRYPESFGLSAIEGMAMSCLTVVRDRGGLGEIGSEAGCLMFVEDAELGVCLKKLIATPKDELRSLAERQYTQTMQRYGSERFSQKLRLWLEYCAGEEA